MLKDLEILYGRFPRQFATPTRVNINSLSELEEMIDSYNGKTRCFCTLYNYSGVDSKVILDKVCFDFDSLILVDNEPVSWHDTVKLHKYLTQEDLMHTIIFSGKGFHVYVFAEQPNRGESSKALLEAAQMFFVEKLHLTIDPTCVGDIARFFGIPSTINLKHNLFVCFISEEDLMKGYSFLKEKAKNQHSQMIIYGRNKMSFDNLKVDSSIIDMSSMKISDFNIEIDDKILSNAPPCIIQALTDTNKDWKGTHWKARWLFAVWAKENGWSPIMIDNIARKYFSKFPRTDGLKNNYNHFKKVNVLNYVFQRDEFFPQCEKVSKMGLCPGKCKYYPLNKSLYMDVRKNGN